MFWHHALGHVEGLFQSTGITHVEWVDLPKQDRDVKLPTMSQLPNLHRLILDVSEVRSCQISPGKLIQTQENCAWLLQRTCLQQPERTAQPTTEQPKLDFKIHWCPQLTANTCIMSHTVRFQAASLPDSESSRTNQAGGGRLKVPSKQWKVLLTSSCLLDIVRQKYLL